MCEQATDKILEAFPFEGHVVEAQDGKLVTTLGTGGDRAIKRGSRVRHPTLGSGVVLEMEGDGDEARLTVFFEKSGKRKLVAKFANLEML